MVEKAFGPAKLCFKVVLINRDTELDLLQLSAGLFGILLLFALFVEELAEVKNTANWRACRGGHLDQVEPHLLRQLERLAGWHHAEVSALGADDADFCRANAVISSETFRATITVLIFAAGVRVFCH